MALAAIVMTDQVLEPKLLEDGAIVPDPANVLRGEPGAHCRHRASLPANAHHRRLVPSEPGSGRSVDRQAHRLFDDRALGEGVGPGQGERPDIGLVRRIGPVALILHLESLALHATFDARTRSEGMRDG